MTGRVIRAEDLMLLFGSTRSILSAVLKNMDDIGPTMISQLTAVQFIRYMRNGRTSPALCGCEDANGIDAGQHVVKLRGSIQERGLLRELLGAKLAAYFQLESPAPALVILEPQLVNLIAQMDSSKSEMIRASAGLNFGTEALIGFNTWPTDKRIPESMFAAAVDIFAFDALLQNPDRRHDNPNLLVRGDSVSIFDHEVAFSFLLDLFPSPTPWKLDRQGYLVNHVFFRQLKSQAIDIAGFAARLSELSDSILQEIFAEVPEQWNNEDVDKILGHLASVRHHAEEFAEEIRRFLV